MHSVFFNFKSILLSCMFFLISCSDKSNLFPDLATQVKAPPTSTDTYEEKNNESSDNDSVIIYAPKISSETLVNKIDKRWGQLKNYYYNKQITNSTTGIVETKKYRFLPSDIQMAYCFPDYKNEKIHSNYDPHKTGFEIASISKIFTSLWAFESQKRNYVLLPTQFVTEFSFDHENGDLYINGSLDPLFGIDRLEDALQNIKNILNKEGITDFSSIKNIHLYNFIQIPIYTSQTSYELSVQESARSLAQSSTLTTTSFTNVAKYLQKINNPFFKSTNFENFKINNYQTLEGFEDNLQKTNKTKFTSYQRPLNQLIYFVNSFSHNLGSDLLYQLLGGKDAFTEFMLNYYPPDLSSIIQHGQPDNPMHHGFDQDVPFAFYNGSGLPHILHSPELVQHEANFNKYLALLSPNEEFVGEEFSQSKFRNKATCQLIFKAIEGLYQSQSFLKTNLEEILPVNGTGTLINSISKDILMGTFVGKTGTLSNLMTVVGALKTRYGMRPFFLSFFRDNLDENGNYRSNGFDTRGRAFIRSTVTTDMVKLMLEYYTRQGFFVPQADLLAQLNVNTFLARSYLEASALP